MPCEPVLKVLLLGGTREARTLATLLAARGGFQVVSSLAGRVREPRLPEGRVRTGGFGGVDGLTGWLLDNGIDAIVDATHPFAAAITDNAAIAAETARRPIVHLRRPGWTQLPSDRWLRVPALDAAATVVSELGERIFLTIGRQGVGTFARLLEPWFLIRSIDPPTAPLPPRHELLLARGPFTVAAETALLNERRIEALVTKDSGGEQTEAKLTAARTLELPVVMIDRPGLPAGANIVETVAGALAWLRGL